MKPSAATIARYKGLDEVTADEWDSFFDHVKDEWNDDDDNYIRDWYPKIEILEIAYALGRTPWSIERRARELHVRKESFGEEHCRQCGKLFTKIRSNQLFCKRKCGHLYHEKARKLKRKQENQARKEEKEDE